IVQLIDEIRHAPGKQEQYNACRQKYEYYACIFHDRSPSLLFFGPELFQMNAKPRPISTNR
ncbi:hypothetical protein, partial [Alistipes ihumii]